MAPERARGSCRPPGVVSLTRNVPVGSGPPAGIVPAGVGERQVDVAHGVQAADVGHQHHVLPARADQQDVDVERDAWLNPVSVTSTPPMSVGWPVTWMLAG